MGVKSYMIAFKLSAMLSGKYAKTFELAESKAVRLGEKFSKVGSAMSKAVTLPLVAMGKASISAAQEWESAWVGVRKVTNATEEDLQALEATARQMARELPHTHDAIASVFEAGSRLGIAADYLEDFSRTMLAVESVTTLTLDKAASGFANIANVMGTSHADFDRMGSTVLKLGNNFNTTEDDILKMASRLAGSANAIGMTESQLMALSTATGAVGISAEVGATAFNTLMRDMQIAVASGNDSLQQFADIAGKSSGDFQRAFEDDAMSAIASFIGGLNRVEASGGSAAVTLSNMGYNADGIYRTLINLSGGYDVLANALEMSNTAWEENSELTKAVEERYATMESRIQVMKNQMQDAGITIGEMLMPFVEKLVAGISNLAEWFGNLDEGTQRMIVRLGLLAAAAGPVLFVVGKVVKFLGKMNAVYTKVKDTIAAVKGVQEAKNLATAANTKLTKINTAVSEIAKKASAARKAATLAENKALKLAAQAEIVRATSGATSAKAITAVTAAEKAKTVATKAGNIATKHAATLEKIRANQKKVNEAALAATAAAQTASTLTTTKLGKALTFLTAKKALAATSAKAFTASLKGMSLGMKAAANSAVEFERNARVMQAYQDQLETAADKIENLTAMQAANRAEQARLNRESLELGLKLQDATARRIELEEQLNDGSRRSRANRTALEDAINDLVAAEEGYREALEANASSMELVNNLYSDNVRALEEIERAQREDAIETYGLEAAMGVTESAEELIDKVAETILANEAMENSLIDKVNSGFAAFSESIDSAGFDNAGYEIPRGIVVGIGRGEGIVVDAVTTLSRRAMNTRYNRLDGIFTNPADYIGTERSGYQNAFGSQLGFDRFANLSFGDSGSGSPLQAARPIDSINRMNNADTYNSTGGDFHYYGSPITIDGSGLSADELEAVLERYQSGERARMERFYRDKLAREKRLANV